MKIGIDIITSEIRKYIKRGERIAILCNQASVNSKFKHIVDIVIDSGIKPTYVFTPEHGFFSVFQDMVEVKEERKYRGVPVISLYGNTFNSLYPTEEVISDIDTLLVDLFDVGTRFYTFAATIYLFMQKASGKGIKFIICDRPNPIGGKQIEGNGVEDGFRSFVGITNLPVRHSLTIGELALFFRETQKLDLSIDIIKIRGYKRENYLDYYTPHFIPPSPNMPSLNTAFVYPMGCLFEGTNLSEGRGTTRPFEIFGADFIEPFILSRELNELRLDGVLFRPIYFMPKFHKFSDRVIGGIFVHIIDRNKFRPYITGVSVIHTIRRAYGERLKWRTEPYEFVSDRPAIDLLFGSDKIRNMIDNLESLKTITEYIRSEERKLIKTIRDFYIYR